MKGYGEDLAYIHDAGHSDYVLNAAPGLLRILSRSGVTDGLIVDLGCGSGRWSGELVRAGYRVFGVDQSPAMIRLARRRAPAATFETASFLSVDLPACDGITSIGECVNYCFDQRNTRGGLIRLFKRAHRALRPGGVFVFDAAGPARLPRRIPQKNWREGRDWAVLVNVEGDREQNVLCRRIICFRKLGRLYRRSQEVHYLRLYRPPDLVEDLVRCGFQARTLAGYGRFRFPRGITGILAVQAETAP